MDEVGGLEEGAEGVVEGGVVEGGVGEVGGVDFEAEFGGEAEEGGGGGWHGCAVAVAVTVGCVGMEWG